MRRRAGLVVVALVAVLSSPVLHAATWNLLTDATTTATGEARKPTEPTRTFQAYGATTSGAGAATIVIEVSNISTPATDADWITMGTITLTLNTTRTTDGFASTAQWVNVRARVTAISGTGAAVSVRMGS